MRHTGNAPQSGMVRHLADLERALASAGFPAMSPWWRRTVERFYGSKRRQLVLRVGRRGGKSSSLCRVGVLEALFGSHVIPPGDVGVVAIVSVSRDEAAGRLRTVRAILDALQVKHRPVDGGIELVDRPIAFKVYAASVAGVSGFTAICAICDEVAKWADSDTGANPATEVLASLRPTMATQPRARIFLSSSPMGTEDAHATAFAAGETDHQAVAHAPTWVANPSISEDETHALEPSARVWSREYAAIPQAGALGAFDVDDIDRSMLPRSHGPVSQWFGIADPSSGSKDRFTYCRVGLAAGLPSVFVVEDVGAIEAAEFRAGLTMVQAVERIARQWRAAGVTQAFGDQRESLGLMSLFSQQDVDYAGLPWSAVSKPIAVETVRRWLTDHAIVLPAHDRLRRELLNFEERIMPSGQLTFAARRGGHDDFVALLVTAALAADAGAFPMVHASEDTAGAERALLERYERAASGGYTAAEAASDPHGAAFLAAQRGPRSMF